MVIIWRFVFAIVGGLGGYEAASAVLRRTVFSSGTYYVLFIVLGVLLGVAIGILVGGAVGREMSRLGQTLDRATAKVTAAGLVVSSIGLIVGLGVAALISLGLKQLPVVGDYLLVIVFAVSGYCFAYLGYQRHQDIARLFGLKSPVADATTGLISPKVLDTSAIIDGRIGDIVPAHFLEGAIVIPGFVLEELQSIADSTDPLRRARGRRGLECVDALQSNYDDVVIMDRDFPGLTEVDAKLIKLAKELQGRIVTTDFNLNKVAQIQGVEVLNVNDLANAMRPVVLPGESLAVHVVREGKEMDQGVAYLEDGTMVVIEGGRDRLGEDVDIEVTSVLQNPAGKMVFGRLAS